VGLNIDIYSCLFIYVSEDRYVCMAKGLEREWVKEVEGKVEVSRGEGIRCI
jgi:hypothetical protein